jgi:alkanesulfonate monooxygenase SsuD/methylene tetrahydromethanopterin reductase-like flavin-dependent oxidoreductase (luciferase family)
VALSGADGDAIDKALEALGRDPRDRYAVVSRPVAGVSDDRVKRRLRRIIEACDPVWVVALDPDAAHDVFHALGRPELGPGTVTRLMGRSVLALEGLEASLEDEALCGDPSVTILSCRYPTPESVWVLTCRVYEYVEQKT